ncbi:hypothetical protein [Kibdelosporangium aridum]|uniref:Uncharacterized protein n=1 Tax=Kibdelosporangium aridum TaxID=2030 RepID=A0A1W2FJP1_KIBAR|nr:hypothetical protein [Kibdelosporangium aridum]SMD22167.1 hypothetical protein SAMN05661093_07358 [Kibdelosporangium aridum]
MDVQIDVFSGRPNPTVRLGPAAEFVQRLAGLRPSAGRPREGLGYRGLYVLPDPDSPFTEVFVSGGVVLVRDRDGHEQLLADPGRELERWLIDAISSEVDPNLLASLHDDLP